MFTVRFEFLPHRAAEFLPDGQIVTEMEYDNIAEVVAYVQEFSDALHGTLIYCQLNNQIVDLADYTYNN
jgi:hypothetical protein